MLNDRVQFERRAKGAIDTGGNTDAGWEKFGGVTRADIEDASGGEAVLAAKLQGRQVCTVRVRSCEMTRSIVTSDRVVDLLNRRILKIRHVPAPGRDGYIKLMCESGVATG